jgi:recombination protein RecA
MGILDLADLDRAIAEVKNKFGKKILQTFDEKADVEVIPTDLYEFDKASNVGGIPRGKIAEIAGPPSTGKSVLAWQLATSLQKKTGKKILFLDFEQAADKPWIKKLNVPIEYVHFILPEECEGGVLSIEDGFEIMNILLLTGAYCAAIWDSVAASNPKGVFTSVESKGLEGKDVGLVAAALTKGLSVYGPVYRKSGTNLFFINHKRKNLENISNPFLAKFADKEVTPGGTAFKHHADMRIDLKGMDYITKQISDSEGKKVTVKIGQNIKIKFVKNRVGDPYGEEVMLMRKGIGFDIVNSTLKRAIAAGIVVRKSTGPCYLKDDEAIKAPSYDGFWNLLMVNPTLLKNIQLKLNGSALTFDNKNIDLSAAERDLTHNEIGTIIKEEDDEEAGDEVISESPDSKDETSAMVEQLMDVPSDVVVKRGRGRPPKVTLGLS